MGLCLLVVGQVAWPLELGTAAPLRALYTRLMIVTFIPALPGRLLPLLKLDACGSTGTTDCRGVQHAGTSCVLAGISSSITPLGLRNRLLQILKLSDGVCLSRCLTRQDAPAGETMQWCPGSHASMLVWRSCSDVQHCS